MAAMAPKQAPPPKKENPMSTVFDVLKQNKILTDRINRLESNAGGTNGGNSKGGRNGYRSLGSKTFCKNNSDGTRSCRRWDNDNYCWTCGFDIKHCSMTCVYIKDEANHKKEATADNTMGGSQRNMHLRTK